MRGRFRGARPQRPEVKSEDLTRQMKLFPRTRLLVKKEEKTEPIQKCQKRIFKEILREATGCDIRSGRVHFALPVEPVSEQLDAPSV